MVAEIEDIIVSRVSHVRKALPLLKNKVGHTYKRPTQHINKHVVNNNLISKSQTNNLTQVKSLLEKFIKLLDKREGTVTQGRYASIKDILATLKRNQEEYIQSNLNSENVLELYAQTISVAYKLEKIARLKYYAAIRQKPSETSEFAKGVSIVSLANSARAIYAD